jgi:hypothetical protein
MMAETYKKLADGTLQVTTTGDKVVSTMSKREIEGKIAEVQTKIDHLNVDLTEAQAEKAVWDDKLTTIS